MIRPESVELPPLECSLDRTLGDYYQDVSPAILLVESGYHGGLDADGVPLVRYGTQGSFHNPVATAQYALANMIAVRRGEDSRSARTRVQLDSLVASQEQGGEFAGCWMMEHDDLKYPWLRAPWTSAITLGTAISALLRGWELFGDDRYRAAADAAYRAMHEPRATMRLYEQSGADLWYEEYPAEPPLHVLNGHIFALLGVVDHARVTGDAEAEERWRRAADTTLRHLGAFDLGYWSAYDLHFCEPVSVHYQKNIHVPLLRILAALTGEAEFGVVADRWQRYVGSIASRVRWHVALRSHRWRRPAAAPGPKPDAGPSTSLRPFPYPFRAALSICNDADDLTVPSFRRLQAFLTTGADTEWGEGLGLPLGGSFFMFSSPASPNRFTVFDRLTTTITDDGEYILECARRGILDVLHTYGCFTDSTHFTRERAEAALDALRARGITIETWVNHGPSTNVQCIGTRQEWQGDAVGAPGYHADLTVGHGVRWVWTGFEATDSIALDALDPGVGAAALRALKRLKTGARGSEGDHTELVEPYTLRDGQRVRRFYRYSGLGGRTPVLGDLPGQLSSANLDELTRAGGYAVVYQHLAVRRLRPGFGIGVYGPVDESWFMPSELSALRGLARRHHEGEIWVAPTTQLLRYRDVHHGLRWAVRREREHDAIVIESMQAGEAGPPLSVSDLGFLTFYCERPEATRVYLETGDGLELVAAVRANPADASSRRSITVRPLSEAGPLP